MGRLYSQICKIYSFCVPYVHRRWTAALSSTFIGALQRVATLLSKKWAFLSVVNGIWRLMPLPISTFLVIFVNVLSTEYSKLFCHNLFFRRDLVVFVGLNSGLITVAHIQFSKYISTLPVALPILSRNVSKKNRWETAGWGCRRLQPLAICWVVTRRHYRDRCLHQ